MSFKETDDEFKHEDDEFKHEIEREETVTTEEYENADAEVCTEIFKHIVDLTKAYTNNLQQITHTYKAELSRIGFALVLGVRAADHPVVSVLNGTAKNIKLEILDLIQQITKQTSKAKKEDDE